MESENLRILIAESERLRARMTALEGQVAAPPRVRRPTPSEMVLSELIQKTAPQVEANLRGPVFALVEGLRAAADLVDRASENARRHIPGWELPPFHDQFSAAAVELSALSRRVLQQYFVYYGNPYPSPDSVPPTRTPGPGR